MNSIYSYIILIPAVIGSTGVALIIISGLMQMQKMQSNTFLVYHLCLTDSLVFIIQFFVQTSLIVHGSSIFNKTLIYVDFVMINLGLFGSLMATFFMTFERYLVLMYEKHVSLKFYMIGMAFSWIFIAVILDLMIVSQGDLIVVQPSGVYSYLSWTAKENIAFIGICIALTVMAAPTFFMIIAYISIWRKYHTLKNELSKKSSQREGVESIASFIFNDPNEVIILLKAVIIVGTFLVCWTPYICIVLYQISSSERCSDLADFMAALLVNVNPALNPFILIFLDSRIRQNVESSFGFRIWNINDKVTRVIEMRRKKKTRPIKYAATLPTTD